MRPRAEKVLRDAGRADNNALHAYENVQRLVAGNLLRRLRRIERRNGGGGSCGNPDAAATGRAGSREPSGIAGQRMSRQHSAAQDESDRDRPG